MKQERIPGADVYQSTLTAPDVTQIEGLAQAEQELIEMIYGFAEYEGEWFNILLGLSSCLSMANALPGAHPFHGLSQRLLQHFRSALKLSIRLDIGEEGTDAANKLLNQVPIAVGILAKDGSVIGLNQRASDLIVQSSDLSLRDGILCYRKQCVYSQFDNNTGEVASSLELSFENKRPGMMHLTDLRAGEMSASSSLPADVVPQEAYYFSIVPANEAPLNLQLLRDAYQLTDTQLQVLTVILREFSVAGVASELKLQPTTVRDHLSSIYQKLGVNRKPDLIRKILFEGIIQQPPDAVALLKVSKDASQKATGFSPKSLPLPDGRRLAYMDLRPLESALPRRNVLVLHNVMGSCFETPPAGERYAREHNIRLVVPERPGYGESDPLRKPDYQQWSQDVEALLDHLQLEQVYLIGHSLGGTYAMALAEMLPKRVKKVALVSTVTRVVDMKNAARMPVMLRASLQTIRHAPFLIDPMVKMLLGSDLEKFYRKQLNFVRPQAAGRPVDMALIAKEPYRSYSLKNFRRSLMQGSSIWAEELKHGFSDWSFSLRNREINYHIWHGTSDDVITVEMAESLARDINVTRFHRLRSETHLLFHRHFVDIISELLGKH